MNWKNKIKKQEEADPEEHMLEQIEEKIEYIERIVDDVKGNKKQILQVLRIIDKCLDELRQYEV